MIFIWLWFMLVFADNPMYWALTWPLHLFYVFGLWAQYIDGPAKGKGSENDV